MPPRRTGSASGPQTTASGKPASQGGSGNQQKPQQSSGDRDGHRDESHKAQHHTEHSTSRPNSAGQKGNANDSARRSQGTEGKSPAGKRHEGNARSGNTSPSAEGARQPTHRSDSPGRENRDDARTQQPTRRQTNGSNGGAVASGNNSNRHQPADKPQENADYPREEDSKPQKKHTARRGTRAGRLHRQRKPPEEAARGGRGGLAVNRHRDSDAGSGAGSEEAASESADSAYDAHRANETNSSWSEDRGEPNRQNRSQQQRSQSQSQSSSQTQSKQPWLNPSLDFFYKDNLIIINLRNEDEELLHPLESSKPAATAQSSKSKRERDQPTVEVEWHAPADPNREEKGKPESVLQRSHAPKEELKEVYGSDVETSIVDRLKHALADFTTTPPNSPPANTTPPGLNLASHGTVATAAAAASKPLEAPPPAVPSPSASFTVAGSSKEDDKPKLSAKAAPWKPSGQPVDLRLLATQLHVSPAGGAPATGTSVAASRPAAPAAIPAIPAGSTANRGFVPSTTALPFLPQGFAFSGVTMATPIPSPAQIQPANEPAPPFSGPTPTAAPPAPATVSRPVTTLSPLPSLYTDEVWSVESAGWGDIQQILKPRESSSLGTSGWPATSTQATAAAPTPAAKPAAPVAQPTATSTTAPASSPQTPPSPPQAPTPTKAAAKRPGGTLPSPQKSATGASTATPTNAAPAAYAYYPSAGLQWMAPGQPMYFVPNPAATTQQMIYAYAQQPATQYVPAAYVFSGTNPGASQLAWGTYPSASSQ